MHVYNVIHLTTDGRVVENMEKMATDPIKMLFIEQCRRYGYLDPPDSNYNILGTGVSPLCLKSEHLCKCTGCKCRKRHDMIIMF